jgi:hypothetical protein
VASSGPLNTSCPNQNELPNDGRPPGSWAATLPQSRTLRAVSLWDAEPWVVRLAKRCSLESTLRVLRTERLLKKTPDPLGLLLAKD